MLDALRQFVRENTILRRLYYRFQLLRAQGQSDEVEIIERLAAGAPHTFIEFGFHPIQFNCISLAKRKDWSGLLIDGSARQVADAKAVLPKHIEIVQSFLTLENIHFVRSKFERLGILSIDVDGNDYWFLKELIDLKPTVICVEYNATFGLEPITVPYDPAFDRHAKHPTGWYHGASLTALAKVCAEHGYGLAAVSDAGANAFFTRDGNLDPKSAWRPNRLRYEYSGADQSAQWEAVRTLPFARI